MANNVNDEKLLTFLREHRLAALATVSDKSKPLVSTIYYLVDDNFNFYFATRSETAKYANILLNQNVSLVISEEKTLQTVQLQGFAKEIKDADELTKIIEKIAQVALSDEKSMTEIPLNKIKEGTVAFFKIKPDWLRLMNFKNWGNIVEIEKKF